MGVVHGEAFWATTAPPGPLVRRFDASRRVHAERLPASVLRLLVSEGVLFADTRVGLFRRDDAGWRLARGASARACLRERRTSRRSRSSERGSWRGIFGGGLVVARREDARVARGPRFRGLGRQRPPARRRDVCSWPACAVRPASTGTRLTPLEGPGAAFSLAATREGVAIGYGQGVLLPGSSLLSAFHGLPGNQALALAAGESLFVGTPSGLGALDGRRVRWRATGSEGRLPHPWVQALLVARDRSSSGRTAVGSPAALVLRGIAEGAALEPFPETEGVKTSAGGLAEVGGRLYAATEGRGLLRLNADGSALRAARAAPPLAARHRPRRRTGASCGWAPTRASSACPSPPWEATRDPGEADRPFARRSARPHRTFRSTPRPGSSCPRARDGPTRPCSRFARWRWTWASRAGTRA